jgi:hypothetical protein
MGLWDKLTGAVGRDLDRRVGGVEGTAFATFARVDDAQELLARAWIANGHGGRVTLAARDRRDEADRELRTSLGAGRDLRDADLAVDAEVVSTGAALAALVLELSQPDGALETYSVESRFDPGGRARLRLSVHLG